MTVVYTFGKQMTSQNLKTLFALKLTRKQKEFCKHGQQKDERPLKQTDRIKIGFEKRKGVHLNTRK